MPKLTRWIATGAALVAALWMGVALADSWLPPSTETYLSADGKWRLTVEPRPITSPLAYFEDKVAERDNPGGPAGSRQASAIGLMEQRVGKAWQPRWKMPLLNETAPVDALVLAGGQAVTFDNWHSMGFGKDVVVIYDANGKPLASHALADVLPREYVRALPRSVSSLHWRGKPRVSRDGTQLLVPVVVPSTAHERPGGDDTRYIDATFDLATGAFVPMAGDAWTQALASAEGVRTQQRIEEAAYRERFMSPLSAPASDVTSDWHGYLMEAYFRLNADNEDDYPDISVLVTSTGKDAERSTGWLRESINGLAEDGGVLLVAGAQGQQPLVDALLQASLALPKQVEAGARLYVAMDDVHFAKVEAPLRARFPQVMQLDITRPIPQARARIDRYLENEADAGTDED